MKYKSFESVRRCVQKDVEDKGLDVAEQLAKYDLVKQKAAEARAEVREKAILSVRRFSVE